MRIKFSEVEEQTLEHFKGGEGAYIAKMFTDSHCKIMKGRLEPGSSIGLHKHEGNYEAIYILSGHGTVLQDGESLPVEPDECHYCEEGHEHSLMNTGNEDLVFFAIVPNV